MASVAQATSTTRNRNQLPAIIQPRADDTVPKSRLNMSSLGQHARRRAARHDQLLNSFTSTIRSYFTHCDAASQHLAPRFGYQQISTGTELNVSTRIAWLPSKAASAMRRHDD